MMKHHKKKIKKYTLLLFTFNILLMPISYYFFIINKDDSVFFLILAVLVCCLTGAVDGILAKKIAYYSKLAGMWFCRFIFSYFMYASVAAALVIAIALIAGVNFQ